ncbi:MAG: septum formation initiator family protein [Clostridiales Family XIII bacterium]|jgi:cell division protein FtsB|nr:septum formation initiator family protein [Clostridiales Family XIII bacterium]
MAKKAGKKKNNGQVISLEEARKSRRKRRARARAQDGAKPGSAGGKAAKRTSARGAAANGAGQGAVRGIAADGSAQAGSAAKRKRHPSVLRKMYLPFFLVVIAIAAYFVVRIATLDAELDMAKEEYRKALDTRDRLESELEYINDPAYIEQEARTRLRMVKPGELLYVMQDGTDSTDGAGTQPAGTDGGE